MTGVTAAASEPNPSTTGAGSAATTLPNDVPVRQQAGTTTGATAQGAPGASCAGVGGVGSACLARIPKQKLVAVSVVAVVALLVALNIGLVLELRSVNHRLDLLARAGVPGTDGSRRSSSPEVDVGSGGRRDHSHRGRYRDGDHDHDDHDHDHNHAYDRDHGHKHGHHKDWRRGRWHVGQAIAVVAVTWAFCMCCWGALTVARRPLSRGALALLATVVARSLIAAAGLPTRPKVVTVVLASAGPLLALVLRK